MQVLTALWEEAPQTAAELTQRIGAANGWTQATVKTLSARLVQKGAVTAEADGRRYRYRPAIACADPLGAESQRLAARLLGGRVGPLIASPAGREARTNAGRARHKARLWKHQSHVPRGHQKHEGPPPIPH